MAYSRSARLYALLKDDLDQFRSSPADNPTLVGNTEPRRGAVEVVRDTARPLPVSTTNISSPESKTNTPEEVVIAASPQAHETPVVVQPPNKLTTQQTPLHMAQPDLDHDSKRFIWLTDPALSEEKNKSAGIPLPVSRIKLQFGELGAFEESYCPIIEVSKYCYKYIRGDDTQRVASALFDAGKFWARGWDLFYIHHPDYNFTVGLVTESSVQVLLRDINATFTHLDVKIDRWQREHGFATRFPPHLDTHPRYLGCCWSKDECSSMMDKMPGYGFRLPSEAKLPSPDEHLLQAFKAKMDEIAQLQKAKSKAAKEKRIQQVTVTNRAMTQQLKRTQRYLGLLKKTEEQPASSPQAGPASEGIVAVDVSAPVPYLFELTPIFIAIDVEAYERDHSKITEVGICTLDTLDLQGIPPGKNGENWRGLSRNRHFRILENRHLINRDFVDGCPGKFQFGESEFVILSEVAGRLKATFDPPYSKKPNVPTVDNLLTLDLQEIADPEASKPRNVIIVGHDPEQDISYFNRLGFNPLTVPPYSPHSPGLVEVLDTAVLYRTYSRLPTNRKLGLILAEFDIDGWFCHNAGNDAVYTMQTMLAIAVKDAAQRGDKERGAERAASVEARIQAELQEQEDLKRAAVSAFEDAENDDGGVPISPVTTANSNDLSEGLSGLTLHNE